MYTIDFNLLLSRYYPANDNGSIVDNSTGYEAWKKLMQDKAKRLENGGHDYQHISDAIQQIPGIQQFSHGPELPFPSYPMIFDISETDAEGFQHRRSLCIYISLLANYYTFFIEDQIVNKSLTEALGGKPAPPTVYLFHRAAQQPALVKLLSSVEKILSQHLPDHHLLTIYILFSTNCNFYPYHTFQEIKPTLFDLLFGDKYIWPHLPKCVLY